MGAFHPFRRAQDQNKVTTIKIVTESPEETQQLGVELAKTLKGGEVFLLSGGLGAGKTCLTQGIAWGLGVQEYARSPTFVLISEYQGRLTLYHIDLYRLDDVREIGGLGLEEYLYSDGVCIIEWAEKASPILPEEGLRIVIGFAGASRRLLTLDSLGERHQGILDQLSIAGLGTGIKGG